MKNILIGAAAAVALIIFALIISLISLSDTAQESTARSGQEQAQARKDQISPMTREEAAEAMFWELSRSIASVESVIEELGRKGIPGKTHDEFMTHLQCSIALCDVSAKRIGRVMLAAIQDPNSGIKDTDGIYQCFKLIGYNCVKAKECMLDPNAKGSRPDALLTQQTPDYIRERIEKARVDQSLEGREWEAAYSHAQSLTGESIARLNSDLDLIRRKRLTPDQMQWALASLKPAQMLMRESVDVMAEIYTLKEMGLSYEPHMHMLVSLESYCRLLEETCQSVESMLEGYDNLPGDSAGSKT